MKKMVFGALGFIMLLMVLVIPAFGDGNGDFIVVSGSLSAINRHELFVDGIRFFFDPRVKIYLYKDGGMELSLKSLEAVGKVDEATLYLTGNVVKKLVIVKMSQ